MTRNYNYPDALNIFATNLRLPYNLNRVLVVRFLCDRLTWQREFEVKERVRHIAVELKGHAPFTIFGALMGVVFMLIFRNLSSFHAGTLFSFFHPGHVILSAMVTASLFSLHRKKKNFILILLVGYFGAIGIATLSDSAIPHFGGKIFGLNVPTESQIHQLEHGFGEKEPTVHRDSLGDEHEHKIYIGFIEQWHIVNPAALLGILIAYFIPRTKFPHAGHVLMSTWASSSYILMNLQEQMTIAVAGAIFVVLFIAVWVPCCISDIVFPLLFVKSDVQLAGECEIHGLHSHSHETKASEQTVNSQ